MRGLLYMNVAVFIWGFTGILGRSIALGEISLVFWRLVITVSSLALGSVLFVKHLRKKAPVLFVAQDGKYDEHVLFSKRHITLMLPGMTLGIHWICFYGSIKYSNVSVALTCLGTTALIAAILEPLFFRRSIQRSELFLGGLVLFGIAVIYYSHLQFSLGVIYGVLAAVLTVIVSILNKHNVTKYSPIQMISAQMLGAFISVSLAFPLYASMFDKVFEIPGTWDWVYLIILSWGCTIFTFFLWVLALQEVSAFTANVILTLEPVYGIVLAFIFYKEYQDISPYFYVGFTIISAAVALHTYRLRQMTIRQIQQNETPQENVAISQQSL